MSPPGTGKFAVMPDLNKTPQCELYDFVVIKVIFWYFESVEWSFLSQHYNLLEHTNKERKIRLRLTKQVPFEKIYKILEILQNGKEKLPFQNRNFVIGTYVDFPNFLFESCFCSSSMLTSNVKHIHLNLASLKKWSLYTQPIKLLLKGNF